MGNNIMAFISWKVLLHHVLKYTSGWLKNELVRLNTDNDEAIPTIIGIR
jgi:hypothetical protein